MPAFVLLGCLLILGQAETTPTESETPAAAEPAAERWLLMKSLEGTWLGCALDAKRLTISGWTELSFTASTARDSQLPMGFNYRANEFHVQQNWLRLDLPVVTSGTTEPSFGFRSDWIIPGIDYRFTLPRGLWNSQLTGNDGQPNRYGVDPVQFYGVAYVPTIGDGLEVRIGRMFCQYGVESIAAVDNALASHAYTFIYDPFTHTGAMATLKLDKTWSVQFGLMLGNDVFIDPAAHATFMGSVKWAPPDGRQSVLISTILNSGRYDVAEQFNNPNIFDVVYTHKLNDKLSWSFEGLFGYQLEVPSIGDTHWFGILNYLTYTYSEKLSGTCRLEFFEDADGNRTGYEGLYTALTAGLTFRPRKDMIFRPELRYDYNHESRPFEGKHGLFTATADVILRW
jgi:hypothetical protein